MRKKIIIAAFCLLLLVCFVACDKIEEPQFALSDSVSYYDTHLYTGETTNFAVAIVRGRREENFIADGTTGELIDFSTIKITPLHMDLFNKQYSYTLKGVDNEIEGELSKDMFGVSFSAEIKDIDTIGDIVNVTIKSKDIEETIELNNKLKDMLDWEDVLSIAEGEFKEKIESELESEEGFNREIHIKFINNRTDRNSPYYWYLSFISSRNNYWAILIDPETGTVASKKS